MTIQVALTVFDIIGIIMMSFIIIVYMLASFWNIKFLIKTEWQGFSWIKAYSSGICILMSFAYIYLIIKFIFGFPIDTTLFGAMIIRPLIFLLGVAFASSARARLTSLKFKGGGEKWILRHGKEL